MENFYRLKKDRIRQGTVLCLDIIYTKAIIKKGDIMPRGARKKSDNGTYHIMLRGINKQQIFEEKEDYEKFLEVLKSCKAISEFKLYAYCLMGNHIHLLINEEKERLETAL